jgi:hypothetical protein
LPSRSGLTTTISAEAAVGVAPSRRQATPSSSTASIPPSGRVRGFPSQRIGTQVAHRRERASSLVEQGELIIGRQLIEKPPEGSHDRVVIEELGPR